MAPHASADPDGAEPRGRASPGGEGAGFWPAAVIAVAGLAAYANSFSGPFVFDDVPSIVSNATIRSVAGALRTSAGTTGGGRPVLNVSLAVNYALSGTAVWSYHAVNLAIHILAGLTLYGIVRRTLAPRMGPAAVSIGLSAALLWMLHPLQTESVTYIVQRAESLMGLFYLLTLYGFIRGAGAARAPGRAWFALSAAACLLGMGTKEVMVSAPLAVLLYDRTFLAGSFREALRRRAGVHAALAATWLALPYLVLSAHGRGGTAGFGSGVSVSAYARAQLPAIVHYLRLCVWPHPLVFDYGIALPPVSPRLVACGLAVAGLAAATAWALARRPAAGFLGAIFFMVLAPSSSVVPVATEIMSEHRMYLPLIPVAVLAAVGAHRWLGRFALPLCLVLAGGLLAGTWQRNEVYRSDEGLWRDTVDKRPGNARARDFLGGALGAEDRTAEAVAEYEEEVSLLPLSSDAHNNLGKALDAQGRPGEAKARFEEAVRLDPANAEALSNLGHSLGVEGRTSEAVDLFERALRLKPDAAETHNNLGNALGAEGRTAAAIAEYEEALRLNPDYATAHNNLGNALNVEGRPSEAAAQYREALRLAPDLVGCHLNLAVTLMKLPGGAQEAVAHLNEVLRLQPTNEAARQILARIGASAP